VITSPSPGVDFCGVWKKFHRGRRHDSLRDLIPSLFTRASRGAGGNSLSTGDFWALQDVTFRVGPGTTLGIIGRNGAGKSTALKTITRILRPTRGRCVVRGRIGALIEVAAGFHPDLTGRENIFLQGAIMGMRSIDIRKRFDEIVEFSGIAEFLDTPVKRFSSGMNARLGFAIAAHLEPDVLIIDEVLSVGDFAFQARAFERLSLLARSGIPVVVVSHQLDRIAELCTEAILLQRGRLVAHGPPADVIGMYVLGENPLPDSSDAPVRLESCTILGHSEIKSGESVRLRVGGTVTRTVSVPLEHVAVAVRALHTGKLIFATSTSRCNVAMPPSGPFLLEVELQLNVPVGNYVVETGVYDPIRHRQIATGPVVRLQVREGASFWGSVQMNPTMALLPAVTAATVARSDPPVPGVPHTAQPPLA
jgi:ABC-type polysaccharide/polyol phosphate transport system ATPase subunit